MNQAFVLFCYFSLFFEYVGFCLKVVVVKCVVRTLNKRLKHLLYLLVI
jgi:hypothetical protein